MLGNAAPFHILAGPLEIFLAPVATVFPLLGATPAADWVNLGTSTAARDITEEGVKTMHQQSLQQWFGLGSTGPRKVFRAQEQLLIEATLADLSVENYKVALNGNTITTVTATSEVVGQKHMGLSRGLTVTLYALCMRGASPYGDQFRRQYDIPVVYVSSEPEPTPTKDTPGLMMLQFTALEDPSAASAAVRFGIYRGQTAAITA